MSFNRSTLYYKPKGENIENLNQTKTIRIYINGVLSSCNTYKTDKFLDASGNAFPLILNACLDGEKFVNFGECEIKFIRIYNSFLTSSEVLNNYVAHIYGQEEQLAMRDRNDVNVATFDGRTLEFRKVYGYSCYFLLYSCCYTQY